MSDSSTEGGRVDIDSIGQRHDVPADAVATLLAAIRRGGGRQAQFSHPALGGMGQWSRGGGIMIGDMFNHSLKAKVERLCNDLAQGVEAAGVSADEQGPSRDSWWPRDLGRPAAVGSQNGEGYASFPDARRLAIRGPDGVRLYDTADHRISGVSQQQSGSRDLSFTSQHGTIRVSDLAPVTEDRVPKQAGPAVAGPDNTDRSAMRHEGAGSAPARGDGDVVGLIERLHELQRKGILTQEEYAAKKTELLARL